MAKSHVARGHEQCPVCGVKHNESVILDTRLRDSFEEGVSLLTGFSLCPEHQQLRDDGYVFIIAVKGKDNLPQGKTAIVREDEFIDAIGEGDMNVHGIFLMDIDVFEDFFVQEVRVH